jgi:hypothetical protein
MRKVKKIEKEGKTEVFNSLQDAAKSINTRMDDWKVQMFIMNSINTGIRAFGAKWQGV